MKPAFTNVRNNFSSARVVRQPELFAELGWNDLTGKPAYENTCAIRMSLALIKSGITIPGRMRIKAGKYKGKLIEPGQAKLAAILARPTLFGAPEKFAMAEAEQGVASRQGIVSFFDVNPMVQTPQGHIDIVYPSAGLRTCGTICFWLANELWFWQLN
mgnify:CR=1 FL=1